MQSEDVPGPRRRLHRSFCGSVSCTLPIGEAFVATECVSMCSLCIPIRVLGLQIPGPSTPEPTSRACSYLWPRAILFKGRPSEGWLIKWLFLEHMEAAWMCRMVCLQAYKCQVPWGMWWNHEWEGKRAGLAFEAYVAMFKCRTLEKWIFGFLGCWGGTFCQSNGIEHVIFNNLLT